MFKRAEPETQRDEQMPPLIQSDPSASPAAGATSAADVSVLPKGAKLEGTLRTASNLRIHGEFKGTIITGGDAILGPGSHVEGDIRAQNVTVGGHHRGILMAQNRATLGDAARVVGTISCRGLVITEGAWFDGKLSMGPPPAESLERTEGKPVTGN